MKTSLKSWYRGPLEFLLSVGRQLEGPPSVEDPKKGLYIQTLFNVFYYCGLFQRPLERPSSDLFDAFYLYIEVNRG